MLGSTIRFCITPSGICGASAALGIKAVLQSPATNLGGMILPGRATCGSHPKCAAAIRRMPAEVTAKAIVLRRNLAKTRGAQQVASSDFVQSCVHAFKKPPNHGNLLVSEGFSPSRLETGLGSKSSARGSRAAKTTAASAGARRSPNLPSSPTPLSEFIGTAAEHGLQQSRLAGTAD